MGDPVVLEIPGEAPRTLRATVLDFSGTLSRDGVLLEGVAGRLRALAARMRVIVLTADTHGTARAALAGLPIELHFVANGDDKLAFVEELGAGGVVAIGNGRNDAAMVARAAVGIAVVGPEGASGELVRAAAVVVGDIADALDLPLHPRRLTATLRP